jgi:hypothetical protein
VPCYTQKLPDVNGPASAKTPPSDTSGNAPAPVPSATPAPTVPTLPLPALRKHLRPFGSKSAEASK